MKTHTHISLLVLAMTMTYSTGTSQQVDTSGVQERAIRLARAIGIVDTHIDIPYRLTQHMTDISVRSYNTDFDFPRAREGGLCAAFMAAYTPQSFEVSGGAKAYAERAIALVEGLALRWPDKFALARSELEIRDNARRGLVSLPLGMENGIPLEKDAANVRFFYGRGIRYITLVHMHPNSLGDGSMDTVRVWNGLSPFGREVIAEMNRTGMMIDVSHMSDSAFFQTISVSRAPVVATHSSCRFFTPGWERNMSDEMITALAAHGGVIQINFGSEFLRDSIRVRMNQASPAIRAYLREHNLHSDDEEGIRYVREYRKEHNIPFATVSDVADHIDHVVHLTSIDHVGIGSDFDGLGDDLPEGLKDVSGYPNLIAALLTRGYTEEDIRKICGGNLFRVWSEVDRTARDLRPPTPSAR